LVSRDSSTVKKSLKDQIGWPPFPQQQCHSPGAASSAITFSMLLALSVTVGTYVGYASTSAGMK
jgi:hypothetical protein